MAFSTERFREMVAEARWDAASELLGQHRDEAADAILALPFGQQRQLFSHLPTDLAAEVVGQFPYFHAYVLLYSLKAHAIGAIIDAMIPG
jgi:hypothetical protein